MEEQQGQEPEVKEAGAKRPEEPRQPEEPRRDRRTEQVEDAEMMERLQEEIRNLPVSDHLVFMMQSLSGLAVARMGLAADTAGRRDMEQARLAVDAFKALLELLEKARPAGEMAAHRGMLSQLQLAYVAALDAGGKDRDAAADDGDAAADDGDAAAEGHEGA